MKITAAVVAACLAVVMMFSPAEADDLMAADERGEETEATDVTATTCSQLADATEMDRAFSLMFYYGYLAGREGVAVIDGSAVPAQLERVRDFCNAQPDATVIDAFIAALSDESS